MCSRDPQKEPGGVAERIVPDNGPDLASQALRNLCMRLAMHMIRRKVTVPMTREILNDFFAL